MFGQVQTDKSSDRCDRDTVSPWANAVGDIMRGYGERYIEAYQPPLQHINLIRSMRLCRTPGMGGKVYVCKSCSHKHYVYYGCGRGLCCICQGVKRQIWLEKMQSKLLKVPYVHLITTLPHQLNSLARYYSSELYNLMFRTTNETVNYFASQSDYLGAKPGMVSVLHTFGSDMKYHVHVHSLLTFGGIEGGKWVYPKHKKRLCSHKEFRDHFRDLFLEKLDKLIGQGAIQVSEVQRSLIEELRPKRWSYRVTDPAMNIENIELYLARYINRIAITNSRVKELKERVQITYNDYRHQKEGEPAPKAIKTLPPLEFIHQYLQHVPPPYFHRVRYYGIHSSAVFSSIKEKMPHLMRNNGMTIRTTIEIVTQLMKQERLKCKECEHELFDEIIIRVDREYQERYIRLPNIDPFTRTRAQSRSP